MTRSTIALLGGIAALTTLMPLARAADDTDVQAQLRQLRDRITQQQQMISVQQKKLADLERRIKDQGLGQKVQNLDALRATGAPPQPGSAAVAQPLPPQPQSPAQAAAQSPVGQPEEKERPEIQAISNVGGVLTPKGVLTLEPSFEYDNSQVNHFFFAGTEIVNAVFIGGLEATNARQNTLTAALNSRFGITNRMEASLRIPYVYRSDRTANGIDTSTVNTSVTGHDIGDIEAGLHYQINQPTNGGAYYVGNLRVKSNSGVSPFDVPFNNLGQQTELPTGTGAWAIEPSLTVLYPTDPVVLYGNLGYARSFSFNPNKFVPTQGTFTEVQPGDTLRGSFGMGFGINDRVAMSLGYEHDWVQSTSTTVNGIKSGSEELQIGSFNVGLTYALSPRTTLNANIAIGATRDAPDARILFSVPVSFDVAK